VALGRAGCDLERIFPKIQGQKEECGSMIQCIKTYLKGEHHSVYLDTVGFIFNDGNHWTVAGLKKTDHYSKEYVTDVNNYEYVDSCSGFKNLVDVKFYDFYNCWVVLRNFDKTEVVVVED
jgi:hypothetical protein